MTRVVSRQQRFAVDVEREKIADGVRVLGPVQAMCWNTTRLQGGRGGAVE